MSQQVTRGNLSAAAFPFLSELSGRGIVVKQTDQNYIAPLQPKEDADKDIGIPILYYCHNVIATTSGYQSINYNQIVQAAAPGSTNFAGVFSVLETATANRAYVGYDIAGNFYYSLDPYYSWVSIGLLAPLAGKEVTIAYINGVTYVYFARAGCYEFNFTTYTLDSVTLTGLSAVDILGITAVQGYLVAWTEDSVAWSSLIDPTDFTPSLVTGAGGGSVQGAEGNIVCCLPHTVGMVVYTNQNAVAAPVSGNARYPFNFRKLVASGGIASKELVTYDSTTGNHYAYTTSGLQSISLQQAQSTMPEVTDFLAGSIFEDFDETTEEFVITELASVLKKKFKLISDRYLIISYGINAYTHALVYDQALRRWGKLRITHIDVFEFSLLAAEIVETPRRSIAFLKADGSVSVVVIDARDPASFGVAVIGKYQYVRSRTATLQTVEFENVIPGAAIRCVDLCTVKGKTFTKKEGTLLESGDLAVTYGFNMTGINHSILIKGGVNLTSFILNYAIHGRR